MNQTLFKHLNRDIPAGIVVFLVALPLCLGIALGSGAPLFSGIIAGIVGGIVVGSLSGSQLSVSGPAAGLTVIVAGAIAKLPTYEAFLLSVMIAGGMQYIFGRLKAGVIGDYVPSAVIKGMLAAIGLILILKQLPHLVGYDADFEGDQSFFQPDGENTFSEMLLAFGHVSPAAIIIGITALAIQILWESSLTRRSRVLSLIPSPLIVVVVGIVINQLLAFNNSSLALAGNHLVNIPIADSFETFGSFFTTPELKYLSLPQVWFSGATIAVVASLESLLSLEAVDNLDPYKRVSPPNQELKAQGIGNLISGMLGGLPVTAVIVRSSANVNAGARSKFSTVFHGVLLLVCVYVIPGLLNLIPLSALAGILIFIGYKLAKPSLFKEFYRKGFSQIVPFVVTILAIMFTDLLVGILIGIATGLFFTVYSNFRTSVLLVNDDHKYLVRFRKEVSFLNKPILKQQLEDIRENSFVLIDATRADFIDHDIIEVVNDFAKHAPLKNITVEIKKDAIGRYKQFDIP